MSASESEVWAEIDRNLAYWNAPGEGDAALEAWSHFNGAEDVPMGYAVIPIEGPWEKAVEDGEIERRLRVYGGIECIAFAVNVYRDGQWDRVVIWSRKSGVKWLEN